MIGRKQRMREEAAFLVEEALDWGDVTIKRLPTMHRLRCPSCGHQATVAVDPDCRGPRFKCSRCGARI